MSYVCGPADWIDLAVGRLEDAKRSLRERDRLRQAATGVRHVATSSDICDELRQARRCLNRALIFVFVEVKSCMADFKSGHGLTFLGDENWLVCTRDLAHELYDECLLPFGVQVYCPDNGGALRLTYDLRMQAAKSLREDSTLCLLWAMLMDSYSRWRTTWDVFNETGESCDL